MPIHSKPHPRNLITKLAGYTGVITDLNSVTFVDCLLDVMHELMIQRATGVFHVVNPGPLSAANIMGKYMDLVDHNHGFMQTTVEKLLAEGKIVAKRSNVTLQTKALADMGLTLPHTCDLLDDTLRAYKKELDEANTEGV